jgi:hypothetical protein
VKRADTCPGCGAPLLWEVSKQRGLCKGCWETRAQEQAEQLEKLMKLVKPPDELR